MKRITIRIDGTIELISDNKNYNSEVINADEMSGVSVIGKLVGKVGIV